VRGDGARSSALSWEWLISFILDGARVQGDKMGDIPDRNRKGKPVGPGRTETKPSNFLEGG